MEAVVALSRSRGIACQHQHAVETEGLYAAENLKDKPAVYGVHRLFHVLPPLPTIPGVSAIGRVEQVAEDVFDLETGQLVYVDPQVTNQYSQESFGGDSCFLRWQ